MYIFLPVLCYSVHFHERYRNHFLKGIHTVYFTKFRKNMHNEKENDHLKDEVYSDF